MTGTRFERASACPFCGWPGFASEAGARAAANKQRGDGAQMVVIQCPRGAGRWHTNDTHIKSLENFKSMLMAGPPRQRIADNPIAHEAARLSLHGAAAPGPVSPPSEPTASPPPLDEVEACSKVGYGSQVIATAMLAAVKVQGHDAKRVYLCDRCKRWHLTSLDQARVASDIVDEEVVVFSHRDGRTVTVTAGRWPDGGLANVTLRTDTTRVRLLPEHAAALASVLALLQSPPPQLEPT